MLHIFKLNGHRLAYDCAGRKAYPLSSLALRMIDVIKPPLTESCPSSLRYAFAKYDSHDLSEAYAEIYSLYKNGLLFSDNNAASPAVRPPECTVVTTSAGAAVQKIKTAIDNGAKNLHIYIKDATVCLASSLHETFDDKASLRLILDLSVTAVSDEDICAVNDAGDVLWTTANGASVAAAVQDAWNRGFTTVYIDVSDLDDVQKELARLAKACESASEGSVQKEFLPFTESLLTLSGFDGDASACRDCWAREICGGRCLDSSEKESPSCSTQRILTECGIVLAKNI